jgi:mannose-1-phosphate guanylyltransferase
MSGGRGPWAVVLSGGEGARLRPLVHRVLGLERPAQYVPLLGPRSLLRQTLDRVALGVSPERTIVVTVRSHTAYIAEEFHRCAAPPYVDQHAERVVLLGTPATAPAGEDGWIEPGEPLDGDGGLFAVRRLRASPPDSPAPSAEATNGLWNTAIVVAQVRALVRLGEVALPDLSRRLAGIERFAGGDDEPAAVHQAYTLMPRARIVGGLLAPHPERLAVRPLQRVTWSDLGSARRVSEVLTRARVRPSWAKPVDPAAIPA